MSTRAEIDEMLRRLEERLPEWAEVYPEDQFLAMLAQSLDYIAYSADPEARRYFLIRTGCLHPGSCEREHAQRYRR